MKRFRSLASTFLAVAIFFLGVNAPSAVAAANCTGNQVVTPDGQGCYTPPTQTQTQTQQATFNCNGAQIPVGSYCPPATTTTTTTGTFNCNGAQVPVGTNCAPVNNQNQATITCPNGSVIPSTSSCATSGNASPLNCMGNMVPNPQGTACIAPVVGSTDSKGQLDCSVAANSALAACGGTTGINNGSGGINCPSGSFYDQGIQGCKSISAAGTAIDCKAAASANTPACAGGGTASSGSTMMNCKGGYYTVEQCNNAGFIGGGTGSSTTQLAGACATAGGSYNASSNTCSVAGNSMNSTGCMNGMIRSENGACIAPVLSNSGQIDCAAAANKVTTACGGNIAVQNTTTSNSGNNWINCGVGFFFDEGTKGCKSTGAAGGVVNQVATIKCKDGSVRVTAIECDNVGGGSSGVAITCPANQVVAPSGTYCIYPSTGTSNVNAGTYRAECATNPPPASCLGQTVNTFEGNATMAKAANFAAYDANALQIKNGVALNENGQAIGQLAKSASGQSFAVAAPPPPAAAPAAGGKKPAPAPKKKASTAPVILLNVTDANGDEVKDSSGKALTTAPVVKQGNFVFSDRNGKPVMATPTLDQTGKPVEHEGKVLYTKLVTIAGQEALTDADGNPIMAVPLLDENGKPILAKNGEILYAPPLTNALGETIINEKTKQPVLATPMADADGNAALAANKKPFMGQPILNPDNQVLTVAGQPVYTGAAGMPVTSPKLQQIKSAQGQELQFGFGGTLIDEGGNTVLGPDGRPTILSVNATPLMANGLPLVDKNGKACRINPNGQVTDSSGRVILGTDGKAMALGKWETFEPIKVGATKTTVKDPNGKTAVLGLNAQLFDSKGNPILSTTGAPIYFDGKTKSLIDNKGKQVKVDASGKVPGKIATLAYQTVSFAA